MAYRRHLRLLWLASIVAIEPVTGFASWFVEGASVCLTDLEEGEIVMNAEIVPASASRYPQIQLEVIGASQAPVWFQPNQEFDLQMAVPVEEASDLQYVVESSEGGIWVKGSTVGCDARRASAKKSDIVKLRLSGTEDRVRVWAGWATGHEAVTLTRPVVFQRKGTVYAGEDTLITQNVAVPDDATDRQKAMAEKARQRLETMRKAFQDKSKQDPPNRPSLEQQRIIAGQRMQDMKKTIHHQHDYQRTIKSQIGNIKTKMQHHPHHRRASPHDHNFIRRWRKLYEQDEFGSASFNSNNFYYGAIFLLLVMATFFFCGRLPQPKGKHDL